MRILHVGSGFRPLRRGGLVAYAEDLMEAQAARGDDVSYFFSGRYHPWRSRPRLRRWERDGVRMLEVVNSPLYDHGRQPALELSEPRTEGMLEAALAELRPDVVHVHELAGLPSSALDLARAAGAPVVMTLQDYFLLCPAFKLIDADGRLCVRHDVGADCVATTAADPREPGLLYEATVRFELARLPGLRSLAPARRERLIRPAATLATRRIPPGDGRSAAAFQRRREVNVERLNRADALIAMSERVRELYALLGVEPAQLRTVQLTLDHLERLRPRPPRAGGPVTFGTLAALESPAKGGPLLLDAVRELGDRGLGGRYRVVVHGTVSDELAAAARELPAIDVRGPYRAGQLDTLLDEIDVGLMTSVWEEAYGYAGVEFLAKGIPLVANAIGGMVDYAREGETAWLNRSCSAQELAEIMARVVERPEELEALSASVRARRSEIVKPMARHVEEMNEVYAELGARGRA